MHEARKHVQNPLWNPFAYLRRTLIWFMVYFCMPIQLRRYYDIGINEIYKRLNVIYQMIVFNFPIFYFIISRCVEAILSSSRGYKFIRRSEIII